MKRGFVYITASKYHGTIYIGVTSNLIKRIYEHKNKLIEGFSSQYNCKKLVYYEVLDSMRQAIEREKEIKKWSRIKKINLINKRNLEWEDLYSEIYQF